MLHFKRSVVLIVSGLFLAVEKLREGAQRLAGHKLGSTCVVLYYHEVRPEHRARFARQMDALLRCATPVSAGHDLPLPSCGRFAAVTFDDGYQSVLENALPELAKRNVPSTIFVVAGALGAYAPWIKDAEAQLVAGRIVTADQLRSLPSSLVTVGSHSMGHPRVTALSEEEARHEVFESKLQLEPLTGREVTLFSFPHGVFTPQLVELCREAGYKRVFTISPTLAFANPREFVTGRVSVEPSDWPLEFRLKLLGAYRWLPLAYSLKHALLSRLRRYPARASRDRMAAPGYRTP